jgi:hypothetical protein
MPTEEDVRHFYDAGRGWNMFNAVYLTTALRHFLQQEKIVLGKLVTSQPIGHLLEVGCGHGRFMKWALRRQLHYDGFEIVSWLADLAAMSAGFLRAEYPPQRCQVHNHSVSEMERAFADIPPPTLNGQVGLVLFPFNCFGNVADREEVVAALARHTGQVLVSGFLTDGAATEQRAAYYAHCGYTNVTWQEDDLGVLVRADEGLHSYAFRDDFLKAVFAGHGFQLLQKSEFAGIGITYHWSSPGRGSAPAAPPLAAAAQRRPVGVTSCSGIRLTAIEEEDSGYGPTGLVNFVPRPAALRQLSATGVVLECPDRLARDTMVKLDLLQPDPAGTVTAVGRVGRVEEGPTGKFRVGVEFYQPGAEPR